MADGFTTKSMVQMNETWKYRTDHTQKFYWWYRTCQLIVPETSYIFCIYKQLPKDVLFYTYLIMSHLTSHDISFDTWPATIMLRRMRPLQQASMILRHKQQGTYPFQNHIPHDKVGYIKIIIITSAGSSVKNSQSSSALPTRRLWVQQGECWGQNVPLFSDDVLYLLTNFPPL